MSYMKEVEKARSMMTATEKAREQEMNEYRETRGLSNDYLFIAFETFGNQLMAYYKSSKTGELNILIVL